WSGSRSPTPATDEVPHQLPHLQHEAPPGDHRHHPRAREVSSGRTERRGNGPRFGHAHLRLGLRERSRVRPLAGHPGLAGETNCPVVARRPPTQQRDGRRQRRCASTLAHRGTRGDRRGHEGEARLWAVAARLLWRVGRPTVQGSGYQGNGRVTAGKGKRGTGTVPPKGAAGPTSRFPVFLGLSLY